MSSYKLIAPQHFTDEHCNYIKNFKESIIALSGGTEMMIGAKDINSRHIISTDSFAKIVGLKNGNDVTGRLDREMLCEGTVEYASCYVKEDLELINSFDVNKTMSTLNIHYYSDGFRARIFKKYILHHQRSQSILGVIYSGHNALLKDTFKIIPSYAARFDINCSIESINSQILVAGVRLTDYEQEICFLILLGWGFRQIANFMNHIRPTAKKRTINHIVKKKNELCQKFNLSSNRTEDLQEFLVSINFHNKIPAIFFNQIITEVNY